MENGKGILETKFAELTVQSDVYSDINGGGNDHGLFQVMKAVEAAEATIKQQVEENNRLRCELQKKREELEKYKSGDLKYQSPHSGDQWGDHVNEPCTADRIVLRLGNQIGGIGSMDINSVRGLSNSIILQEDLIRSSKEHALPSHIENQFDSSKANGSLKVIHGDQVVLDKSGIPQLVSPSITLFSPTRYQQEDNSDTELRISERGLISMTEVNNHSSSKQDLVRKIREHEEEISQLKKHLAEFSIKEAQIRNEKYAMEKRISYLLLAFDQQQQDLVLAASKAISYRQDIMEENVRLTYALQAAQQERSMFVSSLMPLLAEYSLQPPVADAQSIVSNVKVLFRHLREQLLVTEGKLKESHYQLAPWRSDMKRGLELVPQPAYSDGNRTFPDPQTAMDGPGRPLSELDEVRNSEHDDLGVHSPLSSRNIVSHEAPSQLAVSQTDTRLAQNNEETVSKKVTFGDLVRSSDIDEADIRGPQSDKEPSVNWSPKASAITNLDDPNSCSPYLPPVLEEPSSSFSEAADDDLLPAIEGLQISGEAFPGQELQARGYSINGTTSCNFEWVRHLEDGSFNYVDGAKQPNYLVTADDVDTYLAIEVQPLDDRKRKGELVKVFANEHRKITCDPEMHNCIEKTLYTGHASYKLSLSTGYLDIWEPATLAIKRDGYSIKCSGPSGVVVTEKFSPTTIVSIPHGSSTEFSVVDSLGIERILRVESRFTDISSSRDTIVLTLRLFVLKAGEKKKGRKRSLFFKS